MTEFLKGKSIMDLDPDIIEKAIHSLDGHGYSSRVINKALQSIRVPVSYFCRMKRISNPFFSIQNLKENLRTRGILTATEIGKVITLSPESPRIKAAVLLGALCGLRLGECRGLQVSDVDFKRKLIHVRNKYFNTS
jgi:integrase